jgi:signal peptidase II
VTARWLFLGAVTVGVIVIDQATKALVSSSLQIDQPWAPIESLSHLFTITYTTNTGAVFGIFPDAGVVLLIIAVVVVGLIIYYYRRLSGQGSWIIRLALGLQLGGAIGNLIDRVRLGHVVDFLNLKFWPVFNVADSCIVIGVAILAGVMLLEDRKERGELKQGDEKP